MEKRGLLIYPSTTPRGNNAFGWFREAAARHGMSVEVLFYDAPATEAPAGAPAWKPDFVLMRGYNIALSRWYEAQGVPVPGALSRGISEFGETPEEVRRGCVPVLQEFVATSNGRDIRVWVTGNEVAGHVLWYNHLSFKSNFAAGDCGFKVCEVNGNAGFRTASADIPDALFRNLARVL